jgi:hypothetical protein
LADHPSLAGIGQPAEPVIVSPPLSEPVIETAAGSFTAPAVSTQPVSHKSADVEALEDRLRRLEAVLTSLADTKQLEDRLAERISKRAEQAPVAMPAAAPVARVVLDPPPEPGNAAKSSEVTVEPPRRWLPFFRSAVPAGGATDDGRSRLRRSWLLFDILREFQSILHMYGDPRYRLTWPGRVLPLVFLIAILTSYYWTLPLLWWTPDMIHSILIKVIDLIPAFCMFKVLTREAQRYRDTIPQAPAH